MKLSIKLILIIVYAFSYSYLAGQALSFKNLTIDDGLIQNSIESIMQDKQGYMWIACEGGVSKYDGVSFRNFGKQDGLSDNHVRKVFEDSKGNKWFATNNGITKYDGKKLTNYLTGKDNNITRIYDICEDRNGVLWFITASDGLIKFDKKGLSYLSKENGLPTDSLRSCMMDNSGVIWIGTIGNGIIKIVNGQIKIEKNVPELKNENVFAIFQDSRSGIWIGTTSTVFYFDGKKYVDVLKRSKFYPSKIRSIIEDHSNVLWFGTDGNGLITYDRNKFTRYTVENGLASDIVLCSEQDSRGDLWFGTRDGGICKLAIEKFRIYDKRDGLAEENVFAIYKDYNNDLYFGHYGLGVSVISANGSKVYNKQNGLVNDAVPSIIGDKNGNIWIASLGGVMKYNHKSFEILTNKDGLVSNSIISLFQDSKNNIWFGCEGGISIYDNNLKQIFSSDEFKTAFGDVWINKISEDANGNIWFATDAKGAFKYDGRRLQQYNSTNGLFSDAIQYITHDKIGNLWFATEDAGIVKYDGKKFKAITIKDGMPSNTCYFVIENGDFLYIGTNQGLVKFDYKNFATLGKDAFKIYTSKDGLASSEMNMGAVYKDNYSNLYFGTQKGVTFFNLNDQPILTPSPIYLKNLRVINEDQISNLIPVDEMEFSYKENNLRFEFISVGFTTREKFVYKHRLLGLENTWIESNEPYAQYPYLPPGKYTFEVISRNADGVWNNKAAAFTFEITPPIWQTWWAITMFIFLGVTSMYGFYMMKTEQVKKRNIELANMVKERTKDLEIEKDKSDELLLNILPFSLVQELKSHGAVMPREFKSASILFTDFKAFTFTASILPADKLVAELNEIFLGFDKIVGECGLEKLKTIGDSYMAAGGLPTETEDHAVRVIFAALKMQEFIKTRNDTAALKWEMRAGVHSGQVIAGVVGTKKFTYDIWGDTVNIASRMESSGEPGKVNISAFTYMLIKDYFTCEYRGKVDAKGKGKMDMYFVTGIKDTIYKVFDVDHIHL